MSSCNTFEVRCRAFVADNLDACLGELADYMQSGILNGGALTELAALFAHIPEQHRLAEAVALVRSRASTHNK